MLSRPAQRLRNILPDLAHISCLPGLVIVLCQHNEFVAAGADADFIVEGALLHRLGNRAQAEKAFNTSPKTLANYLVATVSSNGRLRIGMKKSTTVQYDWTCFNNFRVFFIPQTEDTGIQDLTPDLSHSEGVIYDFNGRLLDLRHVTSNFRQLQRGLYIIDGKKIFVK